MPSFVSILPNEDTPIKKAYKCDLRIGNVGLSPLAAGSLRIHRRKSPDSPVTVIITIIVDSAIRSVVLTRSGACNLNRGRLRTYTSEGVARNYVASRGSKSNCKTSR